MSLLGRIAPSVQRGPERERCGAGPRRGNCLFRKRQKRSEPGRGAGRPGASRGAVEEGGHLPTEKDAGVPAAPTPLSPQVLLRERAREQSDGSGGMGTGGEGKRGMKGGR